jgi:hypothetical protein
MTPACGFGFIANVGGCPEPATYRLVIVDREVEAFACRGHLAEAEAAAGHDVAGRERVYTVEPIE